LLNSGTGLISGVPSLEGVSNISLGATNLGGSGTALLALTVTPDGTAVRVNAGGGAVGNFTLGTGFSGGTTAGAGATVSTVGVLLAAPAAVYDTELWSSGSFTYTSPSLAEGRTFEVRLHFAERHVTAVGQRRFNIGINGATSGNLFAANFDAFAAAGNTMNKAAVRVFTNVIPNAQGRITVTVSPGAAQNPMINGIEILAEGVPAPALTSASTLTLGYGQAVSYTITASNSPTSFGASGLPGGLTINSGTGLISGTPGTHGVSLITLSATNSGGTGSTLFTLSVTLNSAQSWRVSYFGTPNSSASAAYDADPDGDGVVNLLEYALGGNPLIANSATLPTLGSSSGHLTFSFFRAQTELTYVVQAASDLANSWTPIATNPGTVGHTVLIEDPVVLNAGEQRFLRLRVTAP